MERVTEGPASWSCAADRLAPGRTATFRLNRGGKPVDGFIVNVNGSGVSLGHPIAATGTRMVVSMVHELARRDARIGVVAMCAGGGMGSALVIERV